MNFMSRSIGLIFKGAIKAFTAFPLAIACALAFSVVTGIRIQLEWADQEAWNLLFNSLHWTFAIGAIFSLMAITAAQTRLKNPREFWGAQIISVLVMGLSFALLFWTGRYLPADDYSRYARLSTLSITRSTAVLVVSLILFILLAGWPRKISDFSRSLFMTLKAFFIALIYGGVIMAGSSGVAGAFQALLYRDMSYKVYQYLGTIVGFLAFTIFAGFFPDFRKAYDAAHLPADTEPELDERRETAQRQPRFIEVLFGYIMIPILLALTAVFLAWSGRSVIEGMGQSFIQLASIATSYAIFGTTLHMLVTRHETGLARFYRRIYPLAALLILGFEAWALIAQIRLEGIKLTEYAFGLLWLFTVTSVVLLLIKKERAHQTIAVIACGLILFSILPGLGYHALPVTAQSARLENLLRQEGLLTDNQITKAAVEPNVKVREQITDAVVFLAGQENAKLPVWFEKDLAHGDVFEARLGFAQTWPTPEYIPGVATGYLSTNLSLPTGAYPIESYQWVIHPSEDYGTKATTESVVNGQKGLYRFYWTSNLPDGVPNLKITREDTVLVDQSLNDYLDQIQAKYPPSNNPLQKGTFEDLSYTIDTPDLTILIVFGNIDITLDTNQDRISYWLNLRALYFLEK